MTSENSANSATTTRRLSGGLHAGRLGSSLGSWIVFATIQGSVPRKASEGAVAPVAIVWSRTEDYVERANVTRFMRTHGIASYEELVKRSRDDVEWFWDAVVKDLGIEFTRPYEQVLDTSDGVPWARWFSGGEVNLAHNCVDRWAGRTPDAVAVIWEGEDGDVRRVTYAELRRMADGLADQLHEKGVRRGDTVGIFMPMSPEAVTAMFACAKVGAIFIPIFSGYGADAVATRLRDANAKALVTADGFLRRGSVVPMKEIADEAVAAS